MKKVQRKSRSTRYESAESWPSWTDEARYVPTEQEERWAAENLNDGAGDATDEYFDLLADEAAHRDRLERGHCD